MSTLLRQRTEVVLGDTMIADLAGEDTDKIQVQPHAELRICWPQAMITSQVP